MDPMKIRMLKANLKSGPLKKNLHCGELRPVGTPLTIDGRCLVFMLFRAILDQKVTTGDNLQYHLTLCFLSNKIETETNKKNLRTLPP